MEVLTETIEVSELGFTKTKSLEEGSNYGVYRITKKAQYYCELTYFPNSTISLIIYNGHAPHVCFNTITVLGLVDLKDLLKRSASFVADFGYIFQGD